ncbi:MAG: gamma-glutamyltransferase [Alphaproteobacteria bacterium]|jgi:gamma-glutamyltranspeptidase/glutathione hydrolase|nr:gamma-glutamyltransferase [Alphaproteobacteria bacterium]
MGRLGGGAWSLALALCLAAVAAPVGAQQNAILSPKERHHPVFAANGMVASQEATASRIGVDILRRGGNAVDAAVAVGFALAVTLPRAGNLGGGGFMLIHQAASGETMALDYREMAPKAAKSDMYLDADGKVDRKRARFSYASAGVPGSVAGLAAALKRYGTLPLATVIEPALRLAERGFTVGHGLARALAKRRQRLGRWPSTAAIFYRPDGSAYQAGDTLVQGDLAWSLRQIAERGAKSFYQGKIARRIAADMAANGGLISLADLAAYRVVWRQPVRGRYRGYQVASMPPPSSGGVHLIQLLNILEGHDLSALGHNGADGIHLLAEAMKLAYADRARHLGDPDFWPVPVRGLTSKAYARGLAAGIDPARARPSSAISHGDPAPHESHETTHFSIMDKAGNVVSNTYTINFSFGSGIVAAGTGILLNNEMDDFSAKPGTANAYGLIGGEANAIAPGKRPLSSMTPTIVFKAGRPVLATGSPGGSRIITMVLQIILNLVDHGLNIAEATAAARIHHQWLPDKLFVERGLGPDTLALLRQRGHMVVESRAAGSVQSVMRTADGGFLGASDPRSIGALTIGY